MRVAGAFCFVWRFGFGDVAAAPCIVLRFQ